MSQELLGVPQGTIKATVLIETLPAAFEMDEILYELRKHSAGLNCGRWDYIFSFIKTTRADPAFVMPDRCPTLSSPIISSDLLLPMKRIPAGAGSQPESIPSASSRPRMPTPHSSCRTGIPSYPFLSCPLVLSNNSVAFCPPLEADLLALALNLVHLTQERPGDVSLQLVISFGNSSFTQFTT